MSSLRWPLASEERSDQELFPRGVRVVGKGEYRGLEFLEVDAKTIINKVPGPPRFGFQYSINAYRGCSHSCTYCFARPTHDYLGLNIGADFDSKIVVKRNAVELARAETRPSRWAGDVIAMGTNTDPYQPAEGKYRLTRGILEVLTERENPVSILTKSPLVLRDIDVLQCLARAAPVRVDFSVGTVDEAVWRESEPGTPHPRRRLEAVARLNAAGVRSGVLIGPILPGRSDSDEQLRATIAGAVDAGVRSIGHVALHLGPGVKAHYLASLDESERALHAELYSGRGKQAHASYRSDLATRVRRLMRELGAPVFGGPAAQPPRSTPTTVAASGQQLALQLS